MIYGAFIIIGCFSTWLSDRYIQRKLFAPRFPNPASQLDTSLLHQRGSEINRLRNILKQIAVESYEPEVTRLVREALETE